MGRGLFNYIAGLGAQVPQMGCANPKRAKENTYRLSGSSMFSHGCGLAWGLLCRAGMGELIIQMEDQIMRMRTYMTETDYDVQRDKLLEQYEDETAPALARYRNACRELEQAHLMQVLPDLSTQLIVKPRRRRRS